MCKLYQGKKFWQKKQIQKQDDDIFKDINFKIL